MAGDAKDLRITTGQLDFSGGVDSGRVTTIASADHPKGLRSDQLAWANNATVRGGGISTRTGVKPLVQGAPWSGLFQGAYIYEPDYENPYIMLSVGGRIYRARVDTDNSVEDLSAVSGLTNPPNEPLSHWVQGEQYLVEQAGDLVTLPLFWDGVTLRRSTGSGRVVGFTNVNFTVPAVGVFVTATLVSPYSGPVNQPITINGKTYMQVVGDNFATIKNISEAGTGNTVPAGALLFDTTGNLVATTLVDFVVPAVGASVPTPVFVTPKWTGALPKDIVIEGESWQITAVGHAAPGANQVFLVNINDTPAAVVAKPAKLYTVPELPAAGPMDYYMGRIWYAIGRSYCAGDIVKGPSGNPANEKRDAILKITENPLAVSGDNFVVPTNAGNIRAITHTAELDTALGEGRLYVGTRKSIYRLNVPVTRDDWSDPNFADKQPLQTVVQIKNGFVGDRSNIRINGDLHYQSVDGIRSFNLSVRNDKGWGNAPISRNERRALNFNDRGLLRFASGIEFDNRLLQTAVPFQTAAGVCHRGILPLDFEVLNSLGSEEAPAWEGFNEGIDVLQLLEGDFGGLQRAFAVVLSRVSGEIEIWELTLADRYDQQVGNDGARVTRVIETPAYTWGRPFHPKELDTLELWYDNLAGTVEFEVFFRPDGWKCWIPWHAWTECSAKDCSEDPEATCDPNYPNQLYCDSYEPSKTLPKPPPFCVKVTKRQCNIGNQFQIKIVTKGPNRLRGLLVHALSQYKAPFANMAPCAPSALALPRGPMQLEQLV